MQLKLNDQILAEEKHVPMYKVGHLAATMCGSPPWRHRFSTRLNVAQFCFKCSLRLCSSTAFLQA